MNHYYEKDKCSVCSKETYQNLSNRTRSKKAVCSRECQNKLVSGSNNFNWTGGRKYKESGHVLLYSPDHPAAKKNCVPEHRVIAETKIGRYLTGDEIVHHINCVKDDNRPENLIVMNKGQHSLAHWSIDKCIKSLLENGAIGFNTETFSYFVIEK